MYNLDFIGIGVEREWTYKSEYYAFQKEGEHVYAMIQECAFGRFLLQIFPKSSVGAIDFENADEPDKETLERIFEKGEGWIEKYDATYARLK